VKAASAAGISSAIPRRHQDSSRRLHLPFQEVCICYQQADKVVADYRMPRRRACSDDCERVTLAKLTLAVIEAGVLVLTSGRRRDLGAKYVVNSDDVRSYFRQGLRNLSAILSLRRHLRNNACCFACTTKSLRCDDPSVSLLRTVTLQSQPGYSFYRSLI
jgi:hypothetical protein